MGWSAILRCGYGSPGAAGAAAQAEAVAGGGGHGSVVADEL